MPDRVKGHQVIYMFTGLKIITKRLDKWKLSVINPASSISVKSDFPIFVNCGLFLMTLLYIGMFVYEPNPYPNTTQTNVQLKYLLKHHYFCNKYLWQYGMWSFQMGYVKLERFLS